MGIKEISGEVECKGCNHRQEMSFDLKERFEEIRSYIASNKAGMHDRAPHRWMNPRMARCGMCGEDGKAKPVIGGGESNKMEEINWLFLLLGEWLGFCTLEQLKYFCMHCGVHRTGAKNRVVYLAYLEVCKQLDPDGPFDH
ncbi:hypothetical protein LINGRAHAP2_LOCUS26029 [Linum grandiflorum]